MNINDLTIGQAKELAVMFGAAQVVSKRTIDHGLQIVVLDRGFVYIGYTTTDGEWCHISRALNIRRWGTSAGLGQLVNGPTAETALDAVGSIKVPFHSLQHLIAVEEAAWKGKFSF